MPYRLGRAVTAIVVVALLSTACSGSSTDREGGNEGGVALDPAGTLWFSRVGSEGLPTLYQIDLGTGVAEQVSDDPAAGVAWSHDRLRMAITGYVDGEPRVWVTGAYADMDFVSDQSGSSPRWSPDCRRLVHVQWDAGRSSVAIVDLQQGSTETLTDPNHLASFPDWSPVEDRIAFAWRSDSAGSDDVAILDLESGVWVVVVRDGFDSHPRWSPDGEWIAFTTTVDGRPQIALLGVDGEEVRVITSGDRGAQFPVWSPDGEWIAHETSDGIALVEAGGGSTRTLEVDGIPTDWTGDDRGTCS
ncbi:MAG: hypothetical protein AAF567_22535 [Actinomycetota bacterium]